MVVASVTVVSGLPRSGTSLMMKMLAAGGMPLLVDGVRQPDTDNPEGYFEFERARGLRHGDTAWVAEAEGRAVKVVSALLQHLPADRAYRVIFMHRDMAEVLASQRKMLLRRGEPADAVPDQQMAELLEKHLRHVTAWLAAQPHMQVLHVNYGRLVADPRPHAEAVQRFLDAALDAEAMAAVVNPALYRNRGGTQTG